MFVQLSLTLTKLCHIRCDHLVNCYMSLEKPFLRNVAIFLQQYDWCTHIWHDDAEHVSLKCIPVKNFNFKNQNGGPPIHWNDPFCSITRYCNFSIFKMAAVRHLGFLKLKSNSPVGLLQRHVLYNHANCCGDKSHSYRDVAIFTFFLLKCSRLIWHNFIKVRDNFA